jgi:hypothetical protein
VPITTNDRVAAFTTVGRIRDRPGTDAAPIDASGRRGCDELDHPRPRGTTCRTPGGRITDRKHVAIGLPPVRPDVAAPLTVGSREGERACW